MTKDFKTQLNKLGLEIEPKLLKLTNEVFSLARKLPKVSDVFEVRYEYQESREPIGTDTFTFDPHEFKRNCDFVEEFWLGKRKAMRVGEKNVWKCNFCEFKPICQRKTIDQY